MVGTLPETPDRPPQPTGVQLFPPEKENALQAEAHALDLPEPEPWEIPRLGETAGFRSLLLRLLELQAWEITVRPAVGGGCILIARRAGTTVQMHGATIADVALPVFQACSRLRERA